MEWNIVISTAIGTMGGTLLTVIAAWGVYTFEKRDMAKNNRANRIVDLINEVTNTLNEMQSHATYLQSIVFLMNGKNSTETIKIFRMDYTEKTLRASDLMSRLNLQTTNLLNLEGLRSLENTNNYIELYSEFLIEELNLNNFNNETSLKAIKDLEDRRGKVQKDLQDSLLNNL